MFGCGECKKSLFEIILGEVSIQDQVLYQVKFRLVLPTECENVLRCHPERSSDTNLLCVVDNWRSLLRFLFFLTHIHYTILWLSAYIGCCGTSVKHYRGLSWWFACLDISWCVWFKMCMRCVISGKQLCWWAFVNLTLLNYYLCPFHLTLSFSNTKKTKIIYRFKHIKDRC